MSLVISRSRIFLLLGQVVHQVEHQLFENHAQSAGAYLAGRASRATAPIASLREVQVNILVLEQPLVLLDDGVARLGQNFDQRGFIQLVEDAHDGQAADELRNQSVLDQVLRLGLAQQFGVAMRARGSLHWPASRSPP